MVNFSSLSTLRLQFSEGLLGRLLSHHFHHKSLPSKAKQNLIHTNMHDLKTDAVHTRPNVLMRNDNFALLVEYDKRIESSFGLYVHIKNDRIGVQTDAFDFQNFNAQTINISRV